MASQSQVGRDPITAVPAVSQPSPASSLSGGRPRLTRSNLHHTSTHPSTLITYLLREPTSVIKKHVCEHEADGLVTLQAMYLALERRGNVAGMCAMVEAG
jgi:hypothetical protein